MTSPSLRDVLRPLADLTSIPKKYIPALERSCRGATFIHILTQLPTGILHRPTHESLSPPCLDTIITLRITIVKHQPPPRLRGKSSIPWRILATDSEGTALYLIFFHAKGRTLYQRFTIGASYFVSGKVTLYQHTPCFIHPDYAVIDDGQKRIPAHSILYPLSQGLTLYQRHKALAQVLAVIQRTSTHKPPQEWIGNETIRRHQWRSFQQSLYHAHHPKTETDLSPHHPARQRLAYDELLAQQLTFAMLRHHHQPCKAHPIQKRGVMRDVLARQLPFALNKEQKKAVADILSDMTSQKRITRLLQGEVGSGKTIIAVFAALETIENKRQVIYMAPTDLLARQVFHVFDSMLTKVAHHMPPHHSVPLPISLTYLGGTLTETEKKERRITIANGQCLLVIGTHALFQEKIQLHNPALIIIDEQQRFGVEQRKLLQDKAPNADVVMMSATPIPRSLALAHYGDMPMSLLRQRATGKYVPRTFIVSSERLDAVIDSVAKRLKSQQGCFWVCPMIDESQQQAMMDTTTRFHTLQKRFPNKVALLHSGIDSTERIKTIDAFRRGESHILVCTTVIETGLDIPEATLMVIEHAERFGLSQLHQLRGRIARHQPGDAILIYHPPLTDVAKKRLETIRSTHDGFHIAQQDLMLRGQGDLAGIKQSGILFYRLAHMPDHQDLLEEAYHDAQHIVTHDPHLQTTRGKNLRLLLDLMGHEDPSYTW